MAENANQLLTYKGHPLMRKENIIYYGGMDKDYVVMMQILASTKEGDLNMATRIMVQLQKTDESLHMKERIVKSAEKSTLWAAMDIASIWLNRALSSK